MEVVYIHNIVKEYSDMIQIIIYKSPQPFMVPDSSRRRRKVPLDPSSLPFERSLRRSKSNIKDLCLCNHFEWFLTFTFDPKKVNSENFNCCKMKILQFFKHQRDKKSPDLKYLIIPELHKSGRVHFHALVKDLNTRFVFSGHYTKAGNEIYNLPSWRYGFTTASSVSDDNGCANYISKYVTKDLVKKFNKHRYFCSNNLIRPKIHKNVKITSRKNFVKLYDSEYYNTFVLDKNNACDLQF